MCNALKRVRVPSEQLDCVVEEQLHALNNAEVLIRDSIRMGLLAVAPDGSVWVPSKF